ncbi:MAG: aldo/keto reductase [Clostridia bacterium]|nr:aldo/keto reductase [Clostridia bacterium]
MQYRKLGKTGLLVSEIGLGAEWLERHNAEECREIIDICAQKGINILDCWMSEPKVRSNIGAAIRGRRGKWFIQGHIGSTWQDGQYVRSREVSKVREAFEDLLTRLQTDYIDLGMIHYVDQESDWNHILGSDYLEYIQELKSNGKIRHIGMSTHNPSVAKLAVESGIVEMIMFSINPAFDLLPATEEIDDYFVEQYDENLSGIAPERVELYRLCAQKEVGITVMKGYAGGRLFQAESSPFGVALTPVQCLHYCLTRPAVASVMVGFDSPQHVEEAVGYETASETEKDYATVLAKAPRHSFHGQCTYCGHCKPCPVEIDIAMVNKLYDLAVMQKETPSSVKEHYKALEKTAADCIGCGGCETRCPFGVPVVQRMEKAKELFDTIK